MCGIHGVISTVPIPNISSELRNALSNRGPDHSGQTSRELHLPNGDSIIHLNFTSTVLALRGDHVAKQPLESSATGSVLCWNGEAWRIDGQPIGSENDGELILAKLDATDSSSSESRESHILNIIRSIDGPFAFLFYDAQFKRLYFGRDRLGRRSLLINQAEDGNSISFSSIADISAAGWKEVEADGVYALNLESRIATSHDFKLDTRIARYEWLSSPRGDNMVSDF